ncbi:MAG: hypothetical protein LQ340_006461, partial [Diploschistes diacapsis]
MLNVYNAAVSATTTQASDGNATLLSACRFADVGINLGDSVFQGVYHDKKAHEDDLDDVVKRALDVGCMKMMVTGSDLKESKHAVEIARRYRGPDALLNELRTLAVESRNAGLAVAFGEVGLDYDRLFLTGKEQQLKYFERQLDLAVELQLPLFLHSRAASVDFEEILGRCLSSLPKKGLVHSFTGTAEEMKRLLAMGLDIGVNGCSLKTEENLEVVREIPLGRMQIETDGPW